MPFTVAQVHDNFFVDDFVVFYGEYIEFAKFYTTCAVHIKTQCNYISFAFCCWVA